MDLLNIANRILKAIGGVNTTLQSGSSSTAYKTDNVLTDVNLDTSTPGDSTPLPVIAYDADGNVLDRVAYDEGLDVWKSIEQAGLEAQYTDPEELVTGADIGAVNDTWLDQGAEVDCRGYKIGVLWIDFTVNSSTGNQIQILVKHTSGGTVEYVLESTASYQKTLGDASISIAYDFPVEGALYFQVQSKATLIGATEGTFDIIVTKEW